MIPNHFDYPKAKVDYSWLFSFWTTARVFTLPNHIFEFYFRLGSEDQPSPRMTRVARLSCFNFAIVVILFPHHHGRAR